MIRPARMAAAAMIVPTLVLGGCASSGSVSSYEQVSAAEAQEIMETTDDCIVVDVRTKSEYDAGHIPGAICIPNETIGTVALNNLPDKDQTILVYCRGGNRSKHAAQKLAEQGYTNVIEFGGIADWPGELAYAAD